MLTASKQPNGVRYRRGGLARLLNIIVPNFAKCAANLGAKAPSSARCVGLFFEPMTLRIYTNQHNLQEKRICQDVTSACEDFNA